jgi:hypothetical protein
MKGMSWCFLSVQLSALVFASVFSTSGFASQNGNSRDTVLRTLLKPEDGITLALRDPLKFVGFFVASDSIDKNIKSCVFRNKFVTIMSDYCTLEDVPAVGMTIHPKDLSLGFVNIYAEGPGKITELDRKKYFNVLWMTSSNKNASGYKANFSALEYSRYFDRKLKELSYGCVVGAYEGATTPRVNCESQLTDKLLAWEPAARKFWEKPSSNWYTLQKRLRKLIIQQYSQ